MGHLRYICVPSIWFVICLNYTKSRSNTKMPAFSWEGSAHFSAACIVLFYFLAVLWKNIGIRKELIPLSKRAKLLLLKEKLLFHHGNQDVLWHTHHMAREIWILSEINFYQRIMNIHVSVARTRIRWHCSWFGSNHACEIL